MKDIIKVERILQEYLVKFQSEIERQAVFKNFLIDSTTNELYDRKNFKGHITASAIIVNESANKVLLIKHKILNRWLQPGGHVDESDQSILYATLREIKEEVNIDRTDLKLVSFADDNDIPFDIDTHLIPINTKKGEEQHFHYDFRYLFVYKGVESIDIELEEVSDYKWMAFDEMIDDAEFENVIMKTRSTLKSDHSLVSLD